MGRQLKHRNIVLVLLVLLFGPISSGIGQRLAVVENHVPKAAIIISSSSSAQIRNVATFLQATIQKSTGALLSISTKISNGGNNIHLGNTEFVRALDMNMKNLDEDGFILKRVNNKNFIILGGTDWGTEFGVYSFLERFLDVQFLMPTEVGTEIPAVSSFYIPNINLIDNPRYISRQISPVYINQDNPLGKWGRKNRLRGRISFSHNLLNLYSPADYSKTNPEFYSNAVDTKDIRWQPNFSARNIADTGAAKIIRFFRSNPNATSYSLGINDSNIFDQSPSSLRRRKGGKNFLGMEDVSDDYFIWANDVARKVTAVYPGKKFGLLAYNNVAEPPSPKIGVNSNLVPFITYERLRWSDTALANKGHQLNKAWEKEAKQIGWYDYTYGLNYLAPRVWFHEMQKYLQWGAQNGVKYYYAELYPNWGEGPKPWIQAKLLWNPAYNLDSLLNVWYVSFAGKKAAPRLKAFYSIWEAFWTKDIFSAKWNTDNGQYLPFNDYSYLDAIPTSYVTNADVLIHAAYALTSTSNQRERVKKLLQMWNIYKTAINLWQQSNLPEGQKNNSLKKSVDFLSLLNNLEKDSLHSLSIQRIKMSLNLK